MAAQVAKVWPRHMSSLGLQGLQVLPCLLPEVVLERWEASAGCAAHVIQLSLFYEAVQERLNIVQAAPDQMQRRRGPAILPLLVQCAPEQGALRRGKGHVGWAAHGVVQQQRRECVHQEDGCAC